jgi:hypothetical protein
MRSKSDLRMPNAAGVTWISSAPRNGELMVKRDGVVIFSRAICDLKL